ncbi:MAG: ABC transporter permease [Bacteroidales bacterium]|nr:ABC transporter permease [Bacteroidales bacterium]
MIRNYINIAFRNIIRNRTISVINISGLAIGLVCSILIFLWIQDEISYDRFHKNSDLLYRATLKGKVEGTEFHQTYTAPPFAKVFKQDFPQVEEVVRIGYYGEILVLVNERVFSDDMLIMADSTLFDVLSYKMIYGNPGTALTEPNSIVITKSTAEKYFGSIDVVNKILEFDDEAYKITGVIDDVPHNTHLHFDMILSMNSWEASLTNDWNFNAFFTYFLLKENSDIKDIENNLHEFVKKHYRFKDSWFEKGNRWDIIPQPITDIHLKSDIYGEFETNGSIRSVRIFLVAALLILILAIANYINLTTSLYFTRAKEIGLRKVIGAKRPELILQFITESILISLISLFLALIIIIFLLPFLNDFTGKNISINFIKGIVTIQSILIFGFAIGILSGIIPSYILSSFKPIYVLKGHIYARRKSYLRITLILCQFIISVVLITSTMVVFQQLHFMQNKNLGFNKENVLVINNHFPLGEKSRLFKSSLLNNPSIESVSGSHNIPGSHYGNIAFIEEGQNQYIVLDMYITDDGFINNLKIDLVDGRFLSNNIKSDTVAIVINRAACDFLNLENPLNKNLASVADKDINYKIIGVIDDFHYASMHQKIKPQAFILLDNHDYDEVYISMRLNSENIEETISYIEKEWNSHFPDLPLSYSFLDDIYSGQYSNEIQISKVMIVFAALSLVIATSGLFGLVTFLFEQRFREISIRKVLGGSSKSIFKGLIFEYAKWIIIACLVGFPLIWFIMDKWLSNFAYRVNLSIQTFILSGCIIFTISLITILFKTLKASNLNPVERLKYE